MPVNGIYILPHYRTMWENKIKLWINGKPVENSSTPVETQLETLSQYIKNIAVGF